MKGIKESCAKLTQAMCKTKNTLTTPTAYSCYAAVGVVAVGVLSVIATVKYVKKINDISNPKTIVIDKPDENVERSETVSVEYHKVVPTFSQKLKVAAPLYLPVIGTAAFTIFCIRHGNNKAMKALADVSSAFNASQDRFQRYKGVAEGAIATEACNNYVREKAIDIPSKNPDEPKYWFFDVFSDRYYYATEFEVLSAAYHFNRNFTLRGYANVNEYYAFLGLEPIEGGDMIGWTMDDFCTGGLEPWIDFDYVEQTTADGEKGFTVFFTWEPKDYEDVCWF